MLLSRLDPLNNCTRKCVNQALTSARRGHQSVGHGSSKGVRLACLERPGRCATLSFKRCSQSRLKKKWNDGAPLKLVNDGKWYTVFNFMIKYHAVNLSSYYLITSFFLGNWLCFTSNPSSLEFMHWVS